MTRKNDETLMYISMRALALIEVKGSESDDMADVALNQLMAATGLLARKLGHEDGWVGGQITKMTPAKKETV